MPRLLTSGGSLAFLLRMLAAPAAPPVGWDSIPAAWWGAALSQSCCVLWKPGWDASPALSGAACPDRGRPRHSSLLRGCWMLSALGCLVLARYQQVSSETGCPEHWDRHSTPEPCGGLPPLRRHPWAKPAANSWRQWRACAARPPGKTAEQGCKRCTFRAQVEPRSSPGPHGRGGRGSPARRAPWSSGAARHSSMSATSRRPAHSGAPCSEPLDYSGTLPRFSPDAQHLAAAVGLQLVVREAESLRVSLRRRVCYILTWEWSLCTTGARLCKAPPLTFAWQCAGSGAICLPGQGGAAGLVSALGEDRLPPARA